MANLQPLCAVCRVTMLCKKNHVVVRDPKAGIFESTYWIGDLWECPVCHCRIVTGFGTAFLAAELPAFAAECSLEFQYDPKEVTHV